MISQTENTDNSSKPTTRDKIKIHYDITTEILSHLILTKNDHYKICKQL